MLYALGVGSSDGHMLIKIGDVNIAGPGWRVKKLAHKPNFDFSSRGGSAVVCQSEDDENTTLDLSFQVYALGGCDLNEIDTLRVAALESELALANSSNGHLVYHEKVDNWSYRRELVAGVYEPNEFELRYRRRPKFAGELRIRVRNSRILEPVMAKAAQAAWVADTYKAVLVMSNTTAAAEYLTDTFIGQITTIDRFDGSGYADLTLLNRVRVAPYLHAADMVWVNLGNGTRQIAGIIIIKFVTNDADSPIVAWIPSSTWGSGNFDPGGTTIRFSVNAKALAIEP